MGARVYSFLSIRPTVYLVVYSSIVLLICLLISMCLDDQIFPLLFCGMVFVTFFKY